MWCGMATSSCSGSASRSSLTRGVVLGYANPVEMRFSFFQIRWCAAAAVMLGGAMTLNAAPANGRPAGRSIEFSGADNPVVSTNFHQAEKRADTLKQVEQDLRAPLDIFSFANPGNALDAPIQRYTPRPLSKQALQQMERNKNWILMTPEELLLGSSGEEALKPSGSGAEERAKQARLQEYYLRRSGLRPGAQGGPWRDSEGAAWGAQLAKEGSAEDAAMPANIRASEKALLKAVTSGLDDESSSLSHAHSGFSDIFHMGGEKSPAEERSMLQHKANMQEYRRVIGAPLDQTASDFRSAHRIDAPAPGATDFVTARANQPDRLSPAYGTLPPLAPGPAQKTFGSTSLLPTTPFITDQHPTDTAPPKPTFLAPKRPFL